MKELKFLFAVWKTNLLSAMEYRVAFISQIIGMMLNDFIYFAIWIIFFDRFKEVRGWGISDMYITYGVLASAFGLVALLFGNTFTLSDIINNGRLVGFFRSANQGVIRILGSDGSENENDQRSILKKIRVVSTLEFQLVD